MANQPFTEDEINALARADLLAFILAGIAYAKHLGREGSDFADFVGQANAADPAPGFSEGARGAAIVVARNGAAAGFSFVSLDGDQSHAEVALADPGYLGEYLQLSGLTPTDGDTICECFRLPAEQAGLTYAWHREGNQLHFSFSK